MSQNYLYFKNNLNYHSLLMGDKGLTSKPLSRLTPHSQHAGWLPTLWQPTPRSFSMISFTPQVLYHGVSVPTYIPTSSWQSHFP